MKTRLLIIIVAITIGVIVASTVGTMEYQSTYNQNCNSDGGKIVGFLKCIYINEDFAESLDSFPEKLGSDCRMIFGKGTTEMYDCLEKIEKVVADAEGDPNKTSVGNDVINTEPVSTPPPEPSFDSKEHYAIEITGLKDVYIVGERYDFSYILSGYGHPCGGKTVTFPDSNGDTIGSASSASCIANLPMGIFVFDIQKEQGTTYGHVEIKNPGTYTVTVTFDRPSQYFPTTVSQEFRVVEE